MRPMTQTADTARSMIALRRTRASPEVRFIHRSDASSTQAGHVLRPLPGSTDERHLIKRFRALSGADRETLLAFADFLTERSKAQGAQTQGAQTAGDQQRPPPAEPREPKPEPRPEKESVVGAIKRLSKTYDMLDRDALLNETSALMSAHVLQGRRAPEVIDELESVFARHYSDYRNRHASEG